MRGLLVVVAALGLCVLAVFATSLGAARSTAPKRLQISTRSQLTAGYAGETEPAIALSPVEQAIIQLAAQDESRLAQTELRIAPLSERLSPSYQPTYVAPAAPRSTPSRGGQPAPTPVIAAAARPAATSSPAGQTRAGPMPRSDYVPLTKIDCSDQYLVRTQNSLTQTSIMFSNRSSQPVQVHWVNHTGRLEQKATLAPGQQLLLDTYLTHPWLVADAAGRCMAIYSPRAQPGIVVID